ncbi:MAG: efflux RND transporter periplasmic adaptor subunit, partial [Pirellulales bacterium]
LSLEAQLAVAHAWVDQANANLRNSEANLDYTEIRAPVDGIVIDRKIDPGQTLAAQFQTPELFIVAPDMEKRMYVYADVDESEIGLVRNAKRRGESVFFTVEAYPGERFEGEIEQIRVSSATTESVVTYPVIVSAPNPDLKLLPGMTADLSFRIKAKDDVLKVPNAALRYYPKERQQVRPEDRKVLDLDEPIDMDDETTSPQHSASERAEAAKKRNRHHVWVEEGEYLKAIEIVTGIYDSRYSELVSGELTEDQQLVTGTKLKNE